MRLDGMDRAAALLAENVHRVPTDTSTQVAHLRELVFAIFAERDKCRTQADADAKSALATALSTSERALTKAEQTMIARFATSDQYFTALDERVRMLMPRTESEAMHKAHEVRISSALERLNAQDERGKGASHNWSVILSVLSAATAVISVVVFISKGL